MDKDDGYWRDKLTDAQYHVLRERGTEPPFSGEYVHFNQAGEYRCAGCNTLLFTSDSKFDATCGWPAFFAPANKQAIRYRRDSSHGMERTEILCANCDGHLGHVFNDGPAPTGVRYCVNSVSLHFYDKNSNES